MAPLAPIQMPLLFVKTVAYFLGHPVYQKFFTCRLNSLLEQPIVSVDVDVRHPRDVKPGVRDETKACKTETTSLVGRVSAMHISVILSILSRRARGSTTLCQVIVLTAAYRNKIIISRLATL